TIGIVGALVPDGNPGPADLSLTRSQTSPPVNSGNSGDPAGIARSTKAFLHTCGDFYATGG
ncbi:MAG: hypothetical protein ACUVXJ_17730, partial [Phycisphaerae bacterium]